LLYTSNNQLSNCYIEPFYRPITPTSIRPVQRARHAPCIQQHRIFSIVADTNWVLNTEDALTAHFACGSFVCLLAICCSVPLCGRDSLAKLILPRIGESKLFCTSQVITNYINGTNCVRCRNHRNKSQEEMKDGTARDTRHTPEASRRTT
jgi:hypothetical protein